ncbi:probable LRR receptor-like serine/threonine-protein kinase At1g56140 isoform X2 [Zingiber officinale]|uniref:probable LRR receptor-like serine/threonine-protein kinase At1g56140 isoform X2 n=1 Tax=Zingiber officinale TaxID=94328 RepID=UPI001C4A8599|nr:probable LRR receptor-like serine/threonine-protein kinase At1g56140 isoform X2 [Zingiber officinale]
MNPGLLLLFFAFCFLFSSAVPQFNDNKPGILTKNDTNENALAAIEEKWGIQIWDKAVDPCEPGAWWSLEYANPRIVCDCSSNCTVTLLKISGKNISREIPVQLFDLTNLTTLDLSRNILNGSIPPQIGQLKQLQNLSLDTNNLTGSIPPDIGNLTKLRNLSLSTNRLSGDIPPEFGELISLEQLYIDSNELTGSLQFGTHVASQNTLTGLKILWAFDNNFTGPLPETIGRFTNLKDLRIFGTSFEGPIPQEYSALTNLETLKLGDLKDQSSSLVFLEKMTNLSFLSLRNCLVDDSIFDRFQNFSSLIFLDLSHNNLKGSIPKYLKNLTSLQYLFLGYNSLTGTVPLELLPESLTTLDISFNNLSGVPPETPNLSLNYIGNFMDVNNTSDRARNMLHCLQENSSCAWNTFPCMCFISCHQLWRVKSDFWQNYFRRGCQTSGKSRL